MSEHSSLRNVSLHVPGSGYARLVMCYLVGAVGVLFISILFLERIGGDGSYSIEGHVRNGSDNTGRILSGIEVTLHEVGLGTEGSTVALTDEGGHYRFDNLQLLPGVAYGISVEYEGVMYGQDVELETALDDPVEMTVFDVTDEIDVISFDSISVLFAEVDARSQTVSVLESVVVENQSDKTYVPGRDPMSIVRFSLPPGATDLSVSTDLLRTDVFQVDVGFGITSSVPPGKHEILYSYSFPYEDTSYRFEKRMIYGSDNLRVMWDSDLFDLVLQSQSNSESVELGSRSYELSEIGALDRGAQAEFNLLNLPEASTSDRFGNYLSTLPVQYLPPAVVAIVLLGVVPVIIFARRRKAG